MNHMIRISQFILQNFCIRSSILIPFLLFIFPGFESRKSHCRNKKIAVRNRKEGETRTSDGRSPSISVYVPISLTYFSSACYLMTLISGRNHCIRCYCTPYHKKTITWSLCALRFNEHLSSTWFWMRSVRKIYECSISF